MGKYNDFDKLEIIGWKWNSLMCACFIHQSLNLHFYFAGKTLRGFSIEDEVAEKGQSEKTHYFMERKIAASPKYIFPQLGFFFRVLCWPCSDAGAKLAESDGKTNFIEF